MAKSYFAAKAGKYWKAADSNWTCYIAGFSFYNVIIIIIILYFKLLVMIIHTGFR